MELVTVRAVVLTVLVSVVGKTLAPLISLSVKRISVIQQWYETQHVGSKRTDTQ